MTRYFTSAALVVLVLLTGCGSAPYAPAMPKQKGAFGSWYVFVSHQGKRDMLCYASALPEESEGSIRQRDAKPYLTVTRRPSGKIEISASAGYRFMPGSKVELAIDDENHSLFYETSVAWARSDAQDKAIIASMKTAEDIELRGVSADRHTSVDYYSSQGFAAALSRIRELCP